LKPREDPLIYGTDKEKSLFSPADGFWRNTAEQLAEAGIGCNLWLFPERFVDVGSVGEFATVVRNENALIRTDQILSSPRRCHQ